MSATSRGPYASGVRRRQQLLDAAFAVFAEQGYRGSSIRVIAQRAGTSHPALMHYFGSKRNLLRAVLERREEVDLPFRAQALTHGILAGPVEIMRRNAEFPGLLYLDATMSAEGIDPEHPAHSWYVQHFAEFMESVTQDLETAMTAGTIRSDISARSVARQLLALINGMQVQWLYDPEESDMAEHIGAFLDLLKPTVPDEG